MANLITAAPPSSRNGHEGVLLPLAAATVFLFRRGAPRVLSVSVEWTHKKTSWQKSESDLHKTKELQDRLFQIVREKTQ